MRRGGLLVLAVVVLASCGGGGLGGGGGSADAAVTFSPDPLAVGPVRWTVTITNDSSDDLKLTFPSGQRADVTLTKGTGTAYRWSRGQMFTQSVGHLTVGAGRNEAFALDEPGLDVDPGDYTLTAWVTATGAKDLKVTRQVTVRGR
jgi:hypothetical protein